MQSQGAIPKTRCLSAYVDRDQGRSRGHQRSKSGKSKSIINFYPDDYGNCEKNKASRKKQKNERENGIIDEEDAEISQVRVRLWKVSSRDVFLTVFFIFQEQSDKSPKTEEELKEVRKNSLLWREAYDSSSGSTTELSSLLPLSSLLSSLHPPSSPLLAAFLATRRELPDATHMPGIDDGSAIDKDCEGKAESVSQPNTALTRNRHRRIKRTSRAQRCVTRKSHDLSKRRKYLKPLIFFQVV